MDSHILTTFHLISNFITLNVPVIDDHFVNVVNSSKINSKPWVPLGTGVTKIFCISVDTILSSESAINTAHICLFSQCKIFRTTDCNKKEKKDDINLVFQKKVGLSLSLSLSLSLFLSLKCLRLNH